MLRPLAFALASVGLVLAACRGDAGGDSGDTDGEGGKASTSNPSGGDGGGGGTFTGEACTVTKTGTAGVVLNGTLLTVAGISQGDVFVDATGKIACVGGACTGTPGYADATVITCAHAVISPGLVNSHDHTEFDTSPPVTHGMTRYDHRNGWRRGTNGEQELDTPSSTDDPATLASAELRFVLGGATSVVGSGGVHGLLRNIAAYPDTSLTEGLVGETVFFDTFPLNDSDGTELTSGCGYTDPRKSSTAFGGGMYAPHVAEGVNAAAENEFACISGSLGLLTNQTSIIHGVGLTGADIQKMADVGANLIWSPRSNIDLYGNTATIPAFKALGITIALGTDWIASGSMNMLRELKCADDVNKKSFDNALTDADLWLSVTHNAARATRFDAELGDLAPGLWGDIAVFAGTRLDYRTVIEAGIEDVRLVLRAGKPLYGDADLVGALQPGCDALPACGMQKAVCVDVPDVTLAGIEAAAGAIYPLFFCKDTVPTDEPSCVPYRDEYPAGVTASDSDGDGIPDASDDCPKVFNPVRPLDASGQSDVDGDHAGDACDAKPTDASAH